MSKYLSDEEFLEYIAMELYRNITPKGKTKEKWLSGILLNYAFMGMARSLKYNGYSHNIAIMPIPEKRLYLEARCNEKKVVGLTYIFPHEEWIVPDEWLLPSARYKPIFLKPPEYEKKKYQKFIHRFYRVKRDEEYDNMCSFLCALYEIQGIDLIKDNMACLCYLFLFYPRTLEEFCRQLEAWKDDTISLSEKYELICSGLRVIYVYLELLQKLRTVTNENIVLREICNVLYYCNLLGIAYKISSGFDDEKVQGEFVERLRTAVNRGVLKVRNMKKIQFNVDGTILEGRNLNKELERIDKKIEAIRKIDG